MKCLVLMLLHSVSQLTLKSELIIFSVQMGYNEGRGKFVAIKACMKIWRVQARQCCTPLKF